MNEKQILLDVRLIASKSDSLPDAIKELSSSLERSLGGKVLLIRVEKDSSEGHLIAYHAERFFDETAGLPCRSLYTVSLRAHGRKLGKLVAFFASGCSHQGLAQSLVNFTGEQLGSLLERISVAEPVGVAL